MTIQGWKSLVESCSFEGQGQYPIAAYSEFMPPVRLGCRPYGGKLDGFFSADDPVGFPITEFEEAFELRPGLENIAHQVLGALNHLVRGEPAERLSKGQTGQQPVLAPGTGRSSWKIKA